MSDVAESQAKHALTDFAQARLPANTGPEAGFPCTAGSVYCPTGLKSVCFPKFCEITMKGFYRLVRYITLNYRSMFGGFSRQSVMMA